MSDNIWEYIGNNLIRSDLRKLKKWRSLEQDIRNHYKIITGKLTDDLLSSVFRCPFGDFITQKTIDDKTIHFYKKKIAILSPRITSNDGARLLVGIIFETKKFMPVLVYGALQEKA